MLLINLTTLNEMLAAEEAGLIWKNDEETIITIQLTFVDPQLELRVESAAQRYTIN